MVRSDSMFRGYWHDEAATEAALRDGWCHTADVGRMDERGLLYLADRKKDVVISGGENVYSPEVENAISAVDGVAACAVVGLPDDRWGEAVRAVVVPPAGNSPTLAALQDGVRQQLARYKVPRRLVLVAELPVLASGKVDKKQLRAELMADAGRATPRAARTLHGLTSGVGHHASGRHSTPVKSTDRVPRSVQPAFDEHAFWDGRIEAGRDGPVVCSHQVACARCGTDSPAVGPEPVDDFCSFLLIEEVPGLHDVFS